MEYNFAPAQQNVSFYISIIDAIPVPAILVTADMRIIGYNETARRWLETVDRAILGQKAGSALKCLNERLTEKGCGHSPLCNQCVIRQTALASQKGNIIYRHKARLLTQEKEKTENRFYLISASPIGENGNGLSLLIFEDIQQILMMSGLVAICANCKKIRDEESKWQPLEHYFQEQLGMDFTHSLCANCAKELYPEIFIE